MRIVILLGVCAMAHAQIEKTLEALYSVKDYPEAAISPDGKHVAWVESARAGSGAEVVETLFVGGSAAPMKGCKVAGLSWSPDSRELAFFAGCGSRKDRQLYMVGPSGGAPKQVTHLKGFLQSARWSHDGKQLAVLFTENAVRAAGPLEPTTPDSGVVEQKVYEQRLTLIDPGSGKARQISPADTYVYEYDWSPDGKQLVYTAAKGEGDNNWWIAQLFTIDASTGEVHPIHKPAAQIAVPRWSRDGKWIAFIGGIMSDEGSTGGDVYRVAATGGEARNLTPDRKTSAACLTWLPANNKLLVTEKVDGSNALTELDTESGVAETLWQGDESVRGGGEDSAISLAADGRTAALVRTSWQKPPEVWAGPLGEWQQKTHGNDGARAEWGEVKKLHWSSDGAAVEGWLIYPKNYDPQRRYPMVVSVHGGPASQKAPAWPTASLDFSLLSGAGYFVLFPNPRGSYGAGERFTSGNVKDFGYGDLRDIIAGVDEAVKTLPIDNNRVGIGGWSYGGYMTMWTVTQTNRFHAAVAGAGIANWQSYYGENSIDEWMIPYFGASVYDDPAVYAKSSPITFIKNVRTPTLVLVGDRDAECPAPQSYEFWHALRDEHVPTQLVIYPNEGHGFVNPEHRRDVMDRAIEWFARYMPATAQDRAAGR